MSESALITALKATLAAGTATADVDGRIYESQAPDDAELPLIRFAVVSNANEPRLATDAAAPLIQFDAYYPRTADSADAWATSGKLRTDLHRKKLAITGVGGGQVQAVDRGKLITEDDAIRVTSSYRVYTNQ